MATHDAEAGRLILVGSSTPLGTQIRKRLGTAAFPVGDAVIAEFDAEDPEGGRQLSELAGAAVLVSPVDEVDFSGADVAVLCGEPGVIADLLDRASGARLCIDASGAASARGDVPWAVGTELPADARLVAAPRPVTITLAAILQPLLQEGLVLGAHGTVLLPASSLGEKAAEELYQQTLGLLTFQELPRDRLAHQLAFNVLPWEDPARPGSRNLGSDLAAEVRSLVGTTECDLQLLLAPTFHGYGYSVRLRTRGASEEAMANCLREAGLHVALEGGAPASPVEALQKSERVLISRIHRVAEDAVWIWAVADSLGAGAAQNVVQVVGEGLRGFAPRA